MKHQNSASSVSRSFISSNFPSVACFRCRMPFERMAGRGKVFGLNTLRRRKILPETALSPDLATASEPCATFASEHREQVTDEDEPQLYHRLLPLSQDTNNVIEFSFLVA
ncbi:hypothetical protein GAP53_05740 [Bacteroides uniformis]|uniref:Uncharacterized protein n=1 Tax=Bacteroides uniformis TaxID=820 RepID=A0A4Q5EAS4_BACUN|nr:hypothetical protein [Bacteroides uniformis]KAB4220706.1 hypothetical protein GAP45_10425 [Bacteroides uniformis]KAB4224729.1 hypothetical protein GAP53_05740 [Bacteroides uniformis]KAB4227877.1 hypothetical protein GAP44_13610 [Bacteroides uniformis]KAB4240697.1 hypothetical protein GAP54_10040 [Bacteroides uniformis]KAB4242263.1 hypothetical protein GAP41_11540 [Bacteroides uniformis]